MYEPGSIPGAQAATDHETRRLLGWVYREDAPGVLASLDPPIEDEKLRPGEKAIEVTRHPEAMLRDEPELWDVVDRFRVTGRKVRRREYDALSSFEVDCLAVLGSATDREMRRQLKPRGAA